MISRGKKTALVIGFVGLAVLGTIGIVGSRELIVLHHLGKLRCDPEHLHAIIDAPPGTVHAEAIRRFLSTADGQERLLSAYMARLRKGQVLGTLWVDARLQELIDEEFDALMFWVAKDAKLRTATLKKAPRGAATSTYYANKPQMDD